MDEDPGWRLLASGELLHVDGDLRVTRRRVLDAPPAHPLTLADLGPRRPPPQAPQTHDRDPARPATACDTSVA